MKCNKKNFNTAILLLNETCSLLGISSLGESKKVKHRSAYWNPRGWNPDRVKRVLKHYELQTEVEAVAEDEDAFEISGQIFTEIPNKLNRLNFS